MQIIFSTGALAVLAACGQHPAAPAWSFAQHLGVVTGTCLAIGDPRLAQGSGLTLVNAMAPQSSTRARVGGPDAACAATGAQGYHVEPGAGQVPEIGVAGYAGEFRTEGGQIVADLDGDGRPEYFRVCTSTEGLHFTVWSGKALTGQLRWHEYHYLGYDVEPDCRPEETATAK